MLSDCTGRACCTTFPNICQANFWSGHGIIRVRRVPTMRSGRQRATRQHGCITRDEYWMDYSAHAGDGIIPARMPDRYVVEMFIDRIAASKNYNKEKYTDDMPLRYYLSGNSENFIHPETRRKLEKLLHMLADRGEAYTMRYIRKKIIPQIRKQKLGIIVKRYK